jgi:Tat protein translocase TatB subunit
LFLFILESIGTSELILIGIVALIFLGPRKLPEIAKKVGKITAEFRGTAAEFKETWKREVNFEEEAKAFKFDDLDSPDSDTDTETNLDPSGVPVAAPGIRELDDAELDSLMPDRNQPLPTPVERAE